MLNRVLMVCLMISLASCKVKKVVVNSTPPVVKADTDKENKLTAIKSAQSNFNTISIKAKANLNIDNSSNDVTMNIRIKNKEAIWVSITYLPGLEVARALITPDSIKILNRFESTYTKKPFSFIYEFANQQINFSMLESILVGNAITEFTKNSSQLTIQGNQATISGLLKSLFYKVQFNDHNKVFKTDLKDEKASQMLTVSYADFISISGNEIPHTVNVKSQASRKNIQIDLKYSKVNINEELEFPFSVPKRFTIKN